jgi:hypothetical protein
MYSINDVFEVAIENSYVKEKVRVLPGKENFVLLMSMVEKSEKLPFTLEKSIWINLIVQNILVNVEDPYLFTSYIPKKLPPKAKERYEKVIRLTSHLSENYHVLQSHLMLSKELKNIASFIGANSRTMRSWVCEWLRSGQNPAAVVSKFSQHKKAKSQQTSGNKRGVKNRSLIYSPNVKPQNAIENISNAYSQFIVKGKRTWKDAYHDMLIEIYKVPTQILDGDDKNPGILLNPSLQEKYQVPSYNQFRYRCREIRRGTEIDEFELPKGSRGKAIDMAPGPGFFEIDATGFQIQLVSRLTKLKLIGSPWVYLIVDISSDAVVGYALTLESPSWTVAAQALYNCFTDKQAVFDRLGLPYSTSDWPAQQLPTVLRADRAELISNQGQKLVLSGISVEICASMTPEAKGTVEGKNSELKRDNGRFDLPGRFEKMRKRRSPNGKKQAALDIQEFETILVETIMDINREPVDPKRLTPDALAAGPKVASRIGFYTWGLKHRPGHVAKMGNNFVYEYLLVRDTGRVTPTGLKFKGETFYCDDLRSSNLLIISIDNNFDIPVSYSKSSATEIFYYNEKQNNWIAAYNVDPEVYRIHATFDEAKNYRSMQNAVVQQAALSSHIVRRERQPEIKKIVYAAIKEKKSVGTDIKNLPNKIRQNRAEEKANERKNSLSTTLAGTRPPGLPDVDNSSKSDRAKPATDTIQSLWERVNATSKV